MAFVLNLIKITAQFSTPLDATECVVLAPSCIAFMLSFRKVMISFREIVTGLYNRK
jgi:hypothetical protein